MAALAYGMTLIITNREPTNWLFQPGREAMPVDEAKGSL